VGQYLRVSRNLVLFAPRFASSIFNAESGLR